MSQTETYLDKIFLVADPDTRIRKADNLMEFEVYTTAGLLAGEQPGNFKRIPKGTKVKLDKAKVLATGSSDALVFAHALSADGQSEYGWTSTRNLDGAFVNESLGSIAPRPGAGKFGPNAAWKAGAYTGQLTLVEIVGAKQKVKHISVDTLEPYLVLVKAAATNGLQVAINSGFRSYPEQKYLYEGYSNHRPGFNLAAKPGRSNHQSGIAFDIALAGADGNPVYEWLKRNAPAHGFIRTVNKEPWHWEYDRAKAATAMAAHTYKTGNVTV
jgi:hypothetical protein